MWLLGTLAFFVQYMIRVSPAPLVSYLIDDFQVGPSEIGAISALCLYSYVAMQIPAGILIDKYGIRLTLLVSCCLCVFTTLLFANTGKIAIAYWARVFFGLNSAFAFIATLKIAKISFKAKHFNIAVGVTEALGMLGAALGISLIARMVFYYPWPKVIEMGAILLAGVSVLIAVFVKLPKSTEFNALAASISFKQQISLVVKNKINWKISLFGGFVFVPTSVFAELWGGYFLNKVHQIPLIEANDMLGIIFIAWGLGSFCMGFAANRFGVKVVLLSSAVLGLVFLPMVCYLSNLPNSLIYILLFLHGFSNAGMALCYTIVGNINPMHTVGIALGFSNSLSILVGAVCQQLMGLIIVRLNTYYTEIIALKLAMLLVVIFSIIAVLIILKADTGKNNILA